VFVASTWVALLMGRLRVMGLDLRMDQKGSDDEERGAYCGVSFLGPEEEEEVGCGSKLRDMGDREVAISDEGMLIRKN